MSPGSARHVLQQRPDRRDPDPAGDQRDPRAAADRGRERAERALGDHARPGRDGAQRRGVVAEPLHGDPQAAAVGRRRQRERMRLPPAVAGEEAPGEELAGLRAQRPQAPAADLHRHDAGRLLDDPDHPQPVIEAAGDRQADPEHHDRRQRGAVERVPVGARAGLADELRARRELVAEGQRDPQVRVEVDEVPGLVASAAAAPRPPR